jgi:hypothetical protein
MISIFPLWTFHLYVATFQQHLHMEYISLRWYEQNWNHLFCRKVSFLADPHSRIGVVGQGMKQTYLYLWYSSCQRLLDYPLWNICVTNDHGYVPLVVNTSRSFPHSRLIIGFVNRLTRRVPLGEQELLPFRSTWVKINTLMSCNICGRHFEKSIIHPM